MPDSVIAWAAAALLLAAVALPLAYRRATDAPARAAFARYQLALADASQARTRADQARRLLARTADLHQREAAERRVAADEQAFRQLDARADRLRSEWGRRWERLGLLAT